jgi:two-component system CheB/CheR fusion protein
MEDAPCNKKSSLEKAITNIREIHQRISSLKRGEKPPGKEDTTMMRLLATVLTVSSEAIIVHDLEGRIIAWNSGAQQIYGYNEDEALKMNVRDLIPENARQEHDAVISKIKAGEEIKSLQTRRLSRDGKIMDVWVTITPLRNNGNEIFALATFERDVTDHNRLLEEFETSLAMAEEFAATIEPLVAERTASLIALNIADRIINPVAVIGAFSRQLAHSTDITDESVRNKLRVMADESERLQQIVRDFNALLDSRRLVFESADLNTVLKEAAMLIKSEADSSGVSLTLDLPAEPVNMNMNRNLLRTAIYYILKNSLEATPPGGSIICKTASTDDEALLVITDTGCGILEEHISRIFDHFFTTKANGTGMGLPFVKFIVQEHFGQISISSNPERGTECVMKFPVRWIRLSEGRLQWNKFILPVSKEPQEYPIDKKEPTPLPSLPTDPQTRE